MIEQLLAGSLFITGPVSTRSLTIVDPSPLHIVCRRVLDKLSRRGTAAVVPDRLDVLVFGEVLGQVVAVTGDDVDHSTGNVGRVKHL